MRDIGIRIQRYRLSRYAPPETMSERARLWLTLGLAGWLIWALFLSDHSAVRLLGLANREAKTNAQLAATQKTVNRLELDLKSADDPAVAERILRERHNFARPGELLYVIQTDGQVRLSEPLPEMAPKDSTAH
jgi:cell division protein FtsB